MCRAIRFRKRLGRRVNGRRWWLLLCLCRCFPVLIPHRPTKLLIEPAACKSLKIHEVASRALASLLITERAIFGNWAGKRAAQGATLARPKAFSLGERAKKIPTDKGWDFEYWWRRRGSNPRPQVLYSQVYMLSQVIWVSPCVRQQAG